MYGIAKSFSLILLLVIFSVSCSTTEDSRYRDTEILERPPTVAVEKKAGESPEIDNSVIPRKKYKMGLGSDVYMTESTPTKLKIKQPIDDAWYTLNLALKQSEIKITDHERDKGFYYVSYKPSSFFENVAGLLEKQHDEQDGAIYLLTVKEDGAETEVTAGIANASEQSSSAKNGAQRATAEGAEDLLQQVYKTLRYDLKED
jgi:uncharacterized lipoprotein